MFRRHILLLATSLAIGGCSVVSAPATPVHAWISVRTPTDGEIPERMLLELAGRAWEIRPGMGGGVMGADLSERTAVRLIGPASCHVYASFEVLPGGDAVIRVRSDGSTTVEPNEGGAREMGPALAEEEPSGCP